MAETQIIDGTSFDASKIRYTTAKVNSSGGKSVGILSTTTNTALKIQTPQMLTWGLSDYEGNEKYEVSLQFPTEEYDTDELRAFRQNMVDFENKIKADALINSKAWFGKQHNSPEVLDALWTPILKYPKDKSSGESDKTKAPSLRVKAPYYDRVWKLEIYDQNYTRLFPNDSDESPLDLIKKGMRVYSLVQCGGLWFVGGKFGVTWKLIQVVVPRESDSAGGCLIRLKSDGLKPGGESTTESSETTMTVVEDSDEDEIPPETSESNEIEEGVDPGTEKKRRIKKKQSVL